MRNHPEVITVLNDLEQKGQLKELRRLRIIDSHTLYDAEVYWLVDAEMVQGQKCKIDSREYEEALKYYQLRARQLHGDNQQLWKEKQYWRRIEKQREAYRKRTKPREYTYEDIYVTTGEFIRETCPF